MKIVGVTCHYTGNHDNSGAILSDGDIVFAEAEERVSRTKHDRRFPIKVIKHGLKINNFKLSDVDYFASASPPTGALKLLSSYFAGMKHSSIEYIIPWFKDRLMLAIKNGEGTGTDSGYHDYSAARLPENKLFFISHYLAHAETAYSFSGMDECLVVAWDGYGLDEKGKPLCGSIYMGENGELTLQEEVPVYSSIALYYGAVTMALGFKLNDGEGKTMGLAVYGKRSGAIKKISQIFPYFDGKKWIPRENWLEVNGVSRLDYFKKTKTYKKLENLIEKYGKEQIAFATQYVLEIESEKYFKYLVRKYKQKKVAVAGGIFLNVKFNMRLLKNKVVDELFVYPNPSDGGVSVGAAIALYKRLGNEFQVRKIEDAYLGCEYSDREIAKALKGYKNKVEFKLFKRGLYKKTARDIVDGKVVGWFQGKAEWGPRALGARSVLADPRDNDTRERINKYLKKRDWFMPFAPVIMAEFKDKVLKHGYGTPFMTLTDDVDKKYVKKIPAASHIDQTARAQIVDKKVNNAYWQVINEFRKLTGVPVLLNTSFNKHGLPIVHEPKHAIEHLLWGCIDELIIGNYLVTKKRLI